MIGLTIFLLLAGEPEIVLGELLSDLRYEDKLFFGEKPLNGKIPFRIRVYPSHIQIIPSDIPNEKGEFVVVFELSQLEKEVKIYNKQRNGVLAKVPVFVRAKFRSSVPINEINEEVIHALPFFEPGGLLIKAKLIGHAVEFEPSTNIPKRIDLQFQIERPSVRQIENKEGPLALLF